jgi:hypothetical protein
MITVFLLLTAPYKGLRPPLTDAEKLDEIFVFLSGELLCRVSGCGGHQLHEHYLRGAGTGGWGLN